MFAGMHVVLYLGGMNVIGFWRMVLPVNIGDAAP